MANQAQYSYAYMGLGMAGESWPQSMFETDKNMSVISMVETADIRNRPKLLARQSTHAYLSLLLIHTFLLFSPT